ncbi:hypothetical protein Leryth_007106 [Lithospermum erythrorhizon]|nr:hypothetical protein Leryth_007106 [Lithospermum erythrorhizon]
MVGLLISLLLKYLAPKGKKYFLSNQRFHMRTCVWVNIEVHSWICSELKVLPNFFDQGNSVYQLIAIRGLLFCGDLWIPK